MHELAPGTSQCRLNSRACSEDHFGGTHVKHAIESATAALAAILLFFHPADIDKMGLLVNSNMHVAFAAPMGQLRAAAKPACARPSRLSTTCMAVQAPEAVSQSTGKLRFDRFR